MWEQARHVGAGAGGKTLLLQLLRQLEHALDDEEVGHATKAVGRWCPLSLCHNRAALLLVLQQEQQQQLESDARAVASKGSVNRKRPMMAHATDESEPLAHSFV